MSAFRWGISWINRPTFFREIWIWSWPVVTASACDSTADTCFWKSGKIALVHSEMQLDPGNHFRMWLRLDRKFKNFGREKIRQLLKALGLFIYLGKIWFLDPNRDRFCLFDTLYKMQYKNFKNVDFSFFANFFWTLETIPITLQIGFGGLVAFLRAVERSEKNFLFYEQKLKSRNVFVKDFAPKSIKIT